MQLEQLASKRGSDAGQVGIADRQPNSVLPAQSGRAGAASIERMATALLRESEERYRALFDRSSDWVYLHDIHGNFLDANPAALSAFGYTKAEVTSTNFGALIHPDDVDNALARTGRLLRTGIPEKPIVYRVRRKDGEYLHVEVQTTVVCIAGEPVAIQGIARDITDRVRHLEAVKAERRRLFSVLDHIPVLVYLQNADYSIGFANRHFRQQFGDPGGRLCYEVIHARTSLCSNCTAMRVLRTGQPETVEGSTAAGGTFVFDIRPFEGDDGNGCALVMGIDITEQKRAFEDRERLLTQLRAILGCLSNPLVAFHSGGVLWTNQAAIDVLGEDPARVSVEEIVRRMAVRYPDGRPVELEDLPTSKAIRLGKTISGERLIIKDAAGRDRTVLVSTAPLTLDGISGGAVVSWEDITEKEMLQHRLSRAERLEMAGRVAGQVAHDFNNLLGPLVAFPELIKMQLPENDRAVHYCDEMVKAAQMMADINADMLVLGRRGLAKHDPVDLNERVRRALKNVEPRPVDIRVELALASNLMPVSGSASQLLRVVTNLITNALDAMPAGGHLCITTENVYVDSSMDGRDRIPIGEYVRLEVADSGCGMPEEVLDRAFEPFFSMKRSDRRRGTGLGLAIVQSVVEDHKGYIDLKSRQGEGTCFGVYLPVHRGGTDATSRTEVLQGTESILVVDDDPLQRTVIEAMLTRLGYRVVLAASGAEALEYLRGETADLMLLDMIMPDGMDGAETYREALSVRPNQKAVVLSGFAQSDRFAEARRLGIKTQIKKPVSMEALARAVRDALDC